MNESSARLCLKTNASLKSVWLCPFYNRRIDMIETSNLTKTFGDIHAVQSLSLSVRKGEVFGLLGPNGAGKTTTIRMLTTLLAPTSGSATVAGFDVVTRQLEVKRVIGVVPQALNLDIDLTCAENLEYHGRLHRMKKDDMDFRIEELLRFVGLWDRRGTPVEHLSGGMRRRLLIARGLMHRPAVLFLDEPTVGLDPQARRMIWDMIEALKREGITIMLTTHYIEEADTLCDRVAVMRKGGIIALDRPGIMKSSVGRFAVECLGRHVGMPRFYRSREEAMEDVRREPCDVVIRDVTLEDVFIRLTGERIEA